MVNTETVCISTRVTKSVAEAIDQILAHDGHVNRADYLRDLVRADLAKREMMKQ
jgi:Arc/MetJ-type ribon-helix-helix transcriptional regulator